MRTINVKEIIKTRGLDIKEVARQLFPKNKYPDLSLNRVMKGKSVLDADQISKLALMAGLQLSELFSGENWKVSSRKGVHVFTNGEFRAELDSETWITKVFHKGSMFHESIIHSGSTPVSEYLSQLDIIINNYKSKNV
jgi:hypothetical protein